MAYYKIRFEVWCDWDPVANELEEVVENIRTGDAICTKRQVVDVVGRPQETTRAALKYDLRTETKLKATVEEVKLPPKGREEEIADLLGKIPTEMVDVHLCPSSFLNEIGVSFSKADEIAVTGSTVKQEGADLVLAREVVCGRMTR